MQKLLALLDTWWARLGSGLLAMAALWLVLSPDEHWTLDWGEAFGFVVAFCTWILATLRSALAPAHPSDVRLFNEFDLLVVHDERLFLGRHDFLNEFRSSRLRGTREIYGQWEGPRYQFIDVRVQADWEKAREAVEEFFLRVVRDTAPARGRVEFQTVRTSRGDDVTELERREARELNEAATKLATAFDKFEATARRRLKV